MPSHLQRKLAMQQNKTQFVLPESDLKFFNQEGIIPGPSETEEEYRIRADYCLNLCHHFPSYFQDAFKVEVSTLSKEEMGKAFAETRETYDITPSWIPLIYSNHKLAPWHGGCAWIYQLSEETPTAAFFQLRKNFKNNANYLGIYNRDEIVAHELAHVGRMMFEEDKFEEILAYRSSNSWFRRWFGPIVKSSFESGIFVLSLFLVMAADLFFLSDFSQIGRAFWINSFPLILIIFALIRLIWRQRQMSKCLKKLEILLKDKSKGQAVAYRLTDNEIIHFASSSCEAIFSYIEKEKLKTIRWKLIHLIYFSGRE